MSDLIERVKGQRPEANYRLHIRTSKDVVDALNKICKDAGVSRSALIVELIKEFLKTRETNEVQR